jgi:hypothetical protein
MPRVFERAKTIHAVDRAITVIGKYRSKISHKLWKPLIAVLFGLRRSTCCASSSPGMLCFPCHWMHSASNRVGPGMYVNYLLGKPLRHLAIHLFLPATGRPLQLNCVAGRPTIWQLSYPNNTLPSWGENSLTILHSKVLQWCSKKSCPIASLIKHYAMKMYLLLSSFFVAPTLGSLLPLLEHRAEFP